MLGQDQESDARARIYLQPIAAPSILGLYGLAGATFLAGAYAAHWFGEPSAALYLFPFVTIFGGLAQFLASMWAFKARDGVATAIHGTWGSFWIAFGVLNFLFATGRATQPTGTWPSMGFWFIVVAAISWVGMIAATAQNRGLVTVMTFLASASTTGAIGAFLGIDWLMILTGWLFVVAAIAAWYTASALMLEEAFGHEMWGLGKSRHAKELSPISSGAGEPGVIRGQAS